MHRYLHIVPMLRPASGVCRQLSAVLKRAAGVVWGALHYGACDLLSILLFVVIG